MTSSNFHFCNHFYDHISVEHDEKPSHTRLSRFDMNWFIMWPKIWQHEYVIIPTLISVGLITKIHVVISQSPRNPFHLTLAVDVFHYAPLRPGFQKKIFVTSSLLYSLEYYILTKTFAFSFCNLIT